MKSIQGKFLMIVISGMLVLALAISVISVLYISKILAEDADTITEAVANTEALKINQKLRDVEYSVETMANYVTSTIGGIEQIKDEIYVNEYISTAKDTFYAIANESDGALAFYLCLAQDITDNVSGCYFGRISSRAEFEELPDLIPTDLENSPWYYEPKNSGAPVWFAPYYDQYVKTDVISYVIPLYSEHNFIGIIGIDLEFSVLTEMVNEISVYDNGFAYLRGKDSSDKLYYLPVSQHTLKSASAHHGFAEEYKVLENGMTLVVHADYSDIQHDSYRVLSSILIAVIVLMAGFIVIT